MRKATRCNIRKGRAEYSVLTLSRLSTATPAISILLTRSRSPESTALLSESPLRFLSLPAEMIAARAASAMPPKEGGGEFLCCLRDDATTERRRLFWGVREGGEGRLAWCWVRAGSPHIYGTPAVLYSQLQLKKTNSIDPIAACIFSLKDAEAWWVVIFLHVSLLDNSGSVCSGGVQGLPAIPAFPPWRPALPGVPWLPAQARHCGSPHLGECQSAYCGVSPRECGQLGKRAAPTGGRLEGSKRGRDCRPCAASCSTTPSEPWC